MKTIGVVEAQALLAAGGIDLVDVRESDEWAGGHLPGARHVPLAEVKADPSGALPNDRVLLVCARGGRSAKAADMADALGYREVYSLDGGTLGWIAAGLPLEHPPAAPVAVSVARSDTADLTRCSLESADQFDARVPELDSVIGPNLRQLRASRAMSLDDAARLTGLSRSLLGQIELGTQTASLGAVWRIARAFDVPFATLLSAPRAHSTAVIRKASAKRLVSANGRFTSRALFPFGTGGKVEFYELWLAGNGREEAEAHLPGTRENLVVTRGQLALEIAGVRHDLAEGDAIVFDADVPHAYINPVSSECWMHLVMTYA